MKFPCIEPPEFFYPGISPIYSKNEKSDAAEASSSREHFVCDAMAGFLTMSGGV